MKFSRNIPSVLYISEAGSLEQFQREFTSILSAGKMKKNSLSREKIGEEGNNVEEEQNSLTQGRKEIPLNAIRLPKFMLMYELLSRYNKIPQDLSAEGLAEIFSLFYLVSI